MKIYIYRFILSAFLIASIHSCDMNLQTQYDYEASVANPHTNNTAWEYINSRPELFSILIDALDITGLKSYYEQTDSFYTFLALTNTAMESYMRNTEPKTNNINDYNLDNLTHLIKYHIVKGRYSSHYGELQVEPMFVPTLLKGESGLMTMLVRKSPWPGLVGKIVINDAGSNGNSPYRSSRTSNILPINGVIHVFDNYAYYVK